MVNGSAFHQSALFAAAARSDESARLLSGGDRGAAGARNSRAVRPVYRRSTPYLAGRRNSPAGPEQRHTAAGRLRADALSGIARAVHGLHVQLDRQVARDHWIRQRRRTDQGSVQRLVAGGGSEQRAGVGDCDGIRGFYHVGRLCGSEISRGSRRQPAGSGDLVPHARA